MKKIIFFIIGAIFFASCSTLRVSYDYDETYDFSKIKGFVIKHYAKEGENTLVNDRITDALEHEFVNKGYKKTSYQQANVIVMYHYSSKDKIDIQNDYQMVGVRRYGYGGAMVSSSTVYEYTEGTIVVDVFDKSTNKIVWRGVGVLELEQKETPQQRREYVNKIIKEVVQKFPLYR